MTIDITKIFIALLVGFSNIGKSFVAFNSDNGMKKKKKRKENPEAIVVSAFSSLFLADN